MRRLTSAAVLMLVVCFVVLPLSMPSLNAYRFLRFPLGYFLAVHGCVVMATFVVYWFFNVQDKHDRSHNMTIQF